MVCPQCNSPNVFITKTWIMLGCLYGIEGEKKRAKTRVKQYLCRDCGKSFRSGQLIEVVSA
ncbi:MAG: hypothetical protein ACYCPW_10755 [Nitrososphaerales archaeon]